MRWRLAVIVASTYTVTYVLLWQEMRWRQEMPMVALSVALAATVGALLWNRVR